MKLFLVLFLTFFLTSCRVSAQIPENEPGSTPSVTVNALGEITVPADLIQFQIHLTRYHESAREAFHEHKELEEFLTVLLLDEDIPEEDIKAEPISIHSRSRGEQYGFETRQTVILKLDNTDQFEEMQLILIENNFDNFSGRFSSSELSIAEDEALAKAMAEARRKAEILADATGGRLGNVLSVRYSGEPTPFPAQRMEMAYDTASGSLLQFEQSIPVQKNVQVVFELIQ